MHPDTRADGTYERNSDYIASRVTVDPRVIPWNPAAIGYRCPGVPMGESFDHRAEIAGAGVGDLDGSVRADP